MSAPDTGKMEERMQPAEEREMKKNKIETIRDCPHPDCYYREQNAPPGFQTCDYILIEGVPRGCKPSECDKYRAVNKKKFTARKAQGAKGTTNPCYKCKKRKTTCHLTCVKFIAWEKATEEKKAEIKQKKIERMKISAYEVDRSAKDAKKRRNKGEK